MISFGNTSIVNIQYGDLLINSVYHGSDLIWQRSTGKSHTLRYISDNVPYRTVLNAVKDGDRIDLSKLDGSYAGHDYINVFPTDEQFKQFNDYLYYTGPFITRSTHTVESSDIVSSFTDESNKTVYYPEDISCVYLSTMYTEQSIRNLYDKISLFDDTSAVDAIVKAITSDNVYAKTIACNRNSADYVVENKFYSVPDEDDYYSITDVLANFNNRVYTDLSIYLYSFYVTELPLFIPTCTKVGAMNNYNNIANKADISGIFEYLTPIYQKDEIPRPSLDQRVTTNGNYYPFLRLSVDIENITEDYKNYVSSFFIGLHGINVDSDNSVTDTAFSINEPDAFYTWLSSTNEYQMKYLYYEYEERKAAVDKGLVEYPFVRMWYWSVNK